MRGADILTMKIRSVESWSEFYSLTTPTRRKADEVKKELNKILMRLYKI